MTTSNGVKNRKKVIVILGPTSSGKTKLAVELANYFDSEIIGADSRQVYRGMDIGTGKDLEEFSKKTPIRYHLIDVASPKKQFDLAKYQKLAFQAIDDIILRGKLPILAGGSGLYLQAVVDNYKLTDVKKNLTLRKKLGKMAAGRLFVKLNRLAPKMAAKLNQSDKNNKRRLIRYLEILDQDASFKSRTGLRKYDTLIIGLNCSRQVLKQRIAKRLIQRLKEQNMVGEIEALYNQGVSWKRLESFGLEYKFISLYLQKKLNYAEMVEQLNVAINQFSKRQLSWFRRWEKQGAKINWCRDSEEIKKKVRYFIKQ